MKFCKNLQRVADISDPEWAPYWPNYKMLKKLIKELPSLVPSDDTKISAASEVAELSRDSSDRPTPSDTSQIDVASQSQQHGDKTAENTKSKSASQGEDDGASSRSSHGNDGDQPQVAGSMTKSPGEVAFFKLLHAEFKKASRFFDRATEEFTIREARVREGMDIMKQPNSIMVNEKWSLMAKSIYRLYKDLLLLETFAIMSYCSFSKILKKHDKVTGYQTRIAFMSNIVNMANFTNYPEVLGMISRCERLYEEVSGNLLLEGKEGLYEDERLFINMIHRLNEQVLSSDSSEMKTDGKDLRKRPVISQMPTSDKESPATSSLRSLVEENEKTKVPTKVADSAQGSEEHGPDGDDDDSDDCAGPAIATKRAADLPSGSGSPTKKQRTV